MKWRAPLAWLQETLLQRQASDTGHSNLSLCPRIFSVLSAILYLGNVTYKKRATGRDEGLEVGPPEVLDTLSELLKVLLVSTIFSCTCFLATASMVSFIHGHISTHTGQCKQVRPWFPGLLLLLCVAEACLVSLNPVAFQPHIKLMC